MLFMHYKLSLLSTLRLFYICVMVVQITR